ncbi:MAG TPA: DUF4180 domain-containing protein [Sphingobacterium bovisgrunnientis]|jgi:hypothetical protein|uniref:DUF4180 domain-containing protein n=1 Tax=Sphingobacterium bovisgrunnientis TaxID=1874697 RepID=UPI001356D95A|nr:DUF4180 domain-containing protein [Sphingobacterium bovisgrunnientis]HLS37318.1 DUF4180 domain-containing protein [Sphingobacterium bovisgrunnientis]
MEIKTRIINNKQVAEIIADEVIINNLEDALDLIGNVYYQGFDTLILHEKNITPKFFDLKTKLAGDVLQKFTQYQLALIIIGDFEKYQSKSLNDFIYESNQGKQVNFVKTLDNLSS